MAIKIFDKTEGDDVVAQAKRELSILSDCNHPNIVRLYALVDIAICRDINNMYIAIIIITVVIIYLFNFTWHLLCFVYF